MCALFKYQTIFTKVSATLPVHCQGKLPMSTIIYCTGQWQYSHKYFCNVKCTLIIFPGKFELLKYDCERRKLFMLYSLLHVKVADTISLKQSMNFLLEYSLLRIYALLSNRISVLKKRKKNLCYFFLWK